MNQRITRGAIAAIALAMLLSIGAAGAADVTVYETFREQVLVLNEMLDEAIYLAIAGFSSYDSADQLVIAEELKAMFLPDASDPRYETLGDRPITPFDPFWTESYWSVIAPFFTGQDIYVLRDAVLNSQAFLMLAANAATNLPESVMQGRDLEREFRTIYAYLVAARGGLDGPFLTAGIHQLAALLPPMELTIGPDESISKALAELPRGGVLILEPGIYHDRIVITQDVVITGAPADSEDIGSVVIDGLEWDTVVAVATEGAFDVTLKNLTIQGGESGIAASWAESSGTSRLTLESVAIRECGQALIVGGTDGIISVTVTDSIIDGNDRSVVCLGSTNGEFLNCSILDGGELRGDIALYGDSALSMRECTIQRPTGNCLVVAETASLELVDCTVETAEGYYALAISRTQSDSRDEHDWDCGLFTGAGSESLPEGVVTGYGNTIVGMICPDTLAFLTEPKPAGE